MWDIAPDFNAMLVFAEHRYYGTSLPYGNNSYSVAFLLFFFISQIPNIHSLLWQDIKYLGYLTSEQALADFARLISYIKSNIAGASDSPVIAFGGSYGGMLASWMRIKYPHLIVG